MKKISWEEYVENFDSRSEKKQSDYVSDLDSFGSHEEVTEIAMCLEEEASSRLINRAIDAGVRFDEEDIEWIEMFVDSKTWQRMKDTADNRELYWRRQQEKKEQFWNETSTFLVFEALRRDWFGKK